MSRASARKLLEVVGISLETKLQAKVSGLPFSSRTVEDLPAPGSVTCSRSPSVPSTEQRPQPRGPHQPSGTAMCQSRGARRHCPCQSPPTHRGTRREWLAPRSTPPLPRHVLPRHPPPALARTQVDLTACAPPGRGRASCGAGSTGSAPGRPPSTSSSSHKSKHVGSTCALVVVCPRRAWCFPGHPLLGALW